MLVVVTRLFSGDSPGELPEMTLEATYTPTPEVSPNPTPLALEAQDAVIIDGDSDRAVAYPINLQVFLPDGSAPRVRVI